MYQQAHKRLPLFWVSSASCFLCFCVLHHSTNQTKVMYLYRLAQGTSVAFYHWQSAFSTKQETNLRILECKKLVFAVITRGRFTIQTWCWVEKHTKHTHPFAQCKPPMEITEGSCTLSGQLVIYDCASPFTKRTNAKRTHRKATRRTARQNYHPFTVPLLKPQRPSLVLPAL